MSKAAETANVRSGVARSAEPIEVRVINGFQLSRACAPLRLPEAARRLVAFLATTNGVAQRSYVAGSLWPLASEERARGCLRTMLWQLRRTGLELTTFDGQSMRLSPSVGVDLHRASEVAQRLIRDPELATVSDCRCPHLYYDLLPDWYDDWLLVARERFLDLRVHALEVVCDRMAALGHHGEATQAGLAAITAEPLRESAHRALIRAHRAEGNVGAALRRFTQFERMLRREVGAEPSDHMTCLMRQVFGGAECKQEIAG
jgi:DNA-binding SARP family transcriptional activator